MTKPIHLLCFFMCFSLFLSAQKEMADSVYAYYNTQKVDNFEKELPTLLNTLDYFKTQNDTCKISSLSRRISECHEAAGDLDEALQILLWSEEYAKGCSFAEFSKNAIEQSGIYLSLENFDKVVNYILYIQDNWPENAPDSLIGELPNNLAIAYAYLGEMDKSKSIFRQQYQRAKRNNKINVQIDELINLGALHGMLEELDSAEYYLKIAVGLCVQSDCENDLVLLQNLATLAAMRQDPELSLQYLDSAYHVAQRKNNIKAETELLREMSIATKDYGDLEESWDLLIEHANMQDTLFNTELADAIAGYSEKYESEKQSRKIQELELAKLDADLRENELRFVRNLFLSIGVTVILIAIGLWSRLKYISKTKMIIEKERDRSDTLLLNILPAEVAEELKATGASEARDFEKVTVLFSDFESFTQTATQLSAKELVAEINTCFKAFDDIMQKYRIEKIKTIGDAYMAAGGLHKPLTATPNDVLKAGLDMQAFMLSRNAERQSQNLPHFQMRLGIHTGPVVAGIVGVKKFQYDIWGDTVNTASRMESSGQVGKVNISQATYELLKDDPKFSFESRGKIAAKGKGTLEMYFVSVKESPDEA